jgi:hypothetical protein
MLIMREIGQVEYMKILSHVDNTWTVERSIDGAGSENEWANGSVIVNLGGISSGWIEAKGGPDFSLSLWKRTGALYTDTSELMRFGNMKSWNGYPATDIPGFGIGDADRFISFDATYGLRINSPVIIGGNLGFSTDALIYCAFDGPTPYTKEYGGSRIGHLGQTPTSSGGIIFRQGKFGKAIQFAEGTTNLLKNGSFDNVTWNFDWAAVVNLPNAYAPHTSILLYGAKSATYVFNGDAGNIRGVMSTFSADALADYTFSGWIKIIGYEQGTLAVDITSGTRLSFTANTTGWQHFSTTANNAAGAKTVRIFTDSATKFKGTVLLDGLQVEKKAYSTPYCDGSMGTGYAWTGTAHASTSTRATTLMSFARPADINDKMTISTWVNLVSGQSDPGANRYIIRGNAATNIFLLTVIPDGRLQAFWNGSAVNSAINVPTDEWVHVAMTMNGTTLEIFINGESSGSVSASGDLDSANTQIFVGSHSNGGSVLNGLVDDLAIINRALSKEEIKAIAQSTSALNIRRGPFDLYLGGGASGGWLIGNGDGLAGYSSDGTKQAWFGSDGKFYAANGVASAGKDGFNVLADDAWYDTNTYGFTNASGFFLGGMGAFSDGAGAGVEVKSFALVGTAGVLRIHSQCDALHGAQILLQAEGTQSAVVQVFGSSTQVGMSVTYGCFSVGGPLDGLSEGATRLYGAFACNGATPRTSYSVGAAASAGGTGALAGAYDTAAHRDALIALVNKLRTALINNGIAVT